MTSSIKLLLFDLPGLNPGFKIVLKLKDGLVEGDVLGANDRIKGGQPLER